MFREDLPAQCPPAHAASPNDLEVFRLMRTEQATIAAFDSQVKLGTIDVDGHAPEFRCRASSCSVFSDISGARKLKKLPKFRNYNFIAHLTLDESAGLVHNSSGYHWDWWIFADCDILACVTEVSDA